MAMEKLMLRSVLYGVDKIPDTWFEKVPGGFFKDKGSSKKDSNASGSDRNVSSKKGRRQDDQYDDYEDDGYRSEGHRRRHHRSRSSFDGGADAADDDYYYLSDDERRNHRSSKSHRRRHSTEDDQRGQGGGHHRSHRKDAHDGRDPANNPYRRRDLRSPDLNYERPMSGGGSSDRSANRFSMGSSAAAAHPPYPRSSATESPAMQSPAFSNTAPPRNGSIGTRYVPYANIYGQDNQPTRQQHFSPPPTSSVRLPQPYSRDRGSPPVAPPPHGYQQNPFAQQAPTAADAGAGGVYTGQAGFVNQEQDPRWTNGPDPYYSARLYTEYDENDAPGPNSTSARRSSRRDYSPSYDSYDARDQDRRSRSERRKDDKSNTRGKSKSRIRENFDTSQRGLGYGAVGAVTGGLIGNEFGKGAIPTAIGATVGALGANAFEAREKYVSSSHPQQAQSPTQSPTSMKDRRKDGRQDSEHVRDSAYSRGGTRRRRDEGYYSD